MYFKFKVLEALKIISSNKENISQKRRLRSKMKVARDSSF